MLDFLRHIDYSLFHFINHDIANGWLDYWTVIFRDRYTWIPLYIILSVYFLWKYKTKAIIIILYVLLAFALSDMLIYRLLKPLFGRLRPCHNIWMHVRLLLGDCGGQWSFPSSHASNHMAVALSIVLAKLFRSQIINTLWICWALLIGFSQIYVGVHYPFDILGGFIIGAAIALINYHFLLPLLRRLDITIRDKSGKKGESSS